MQDKILTMEKEIVDKYLGIPFKHQGRDLQGLDCYGLLVCVYKDLGMKLLDIKDLGEDSYIEKWAKAGKNYIVENYHKQWVQVNDPVMFDMCVFKNNEASMVHLGIVLNDDKFIHCRIKHGVVLSRLNDPVWKNKLVGFYRLNGWL